jgi:hypothetical protein
MSRADRAYALYSSLSDSEKVQFTRRLLEDAELPMALLPIVWLTLEEAAYFFRKSKSQVSRYAKDGMVTSKRDGKQLLIGLDCRTMLLWGRLGESLHARRKERLWMRIAADLENRDPEDQRERQEHQVLVGEVFYRLPLETQLDILDARSAKTIKEMKRHEPEFESLSPEEQIRIRAESEANIDQEYAEEHNAASIWLETVLPQKLRLARQLLKQCPWAVAFSPRRE